MPILPLAPSNQVGAGAVRGSEEARRLATAEHLDAVVVTGVPVPAADSLAARGTENGRARRVGARVFRWRDGGWIDIAHGDSLRIVTVAPFSDAYFALLRALPELVQPATLEPAVLVAGRRVSIKIEASGKTQWTEGELERLVKEFRG
jgi:hypothetical protein